MQRMSDQRHSDEPVSDPCQVDGPAAVDDRRSEAALTPWQVVGSTVASAFGVQSSRNRERDFRRGKASHFIIAGIVFTVLFVLGLVFVVRLILSAAA